MTVATTVVATTSLSTNYAALIAELGDFTKSMTADETADAGPKKVEAAAAEGGAVIPPTEGDPEGKKPTEPEETPEMMKSFSVTLPDGTVQEVVDGGEMLKSLSIDIGALKGSLVDVTAQLAAVTSERDAAVQFSAGLLAGLKSQGDMLKSLKVDVEKLGNQGTGRKATLVVTEAAAVAKPAAVEATMDTDEFFAKAMTLINHDGFTVRDIAECEARLARGLAPQPALAAAVAKIA